MLENYANDQPIAYQVMKNAVIKNRCSHAYLIEANGYTKKNDIVFAFAKYLLCPKHHLLESESLECPICHKAKENLLDLKVIEAEGLWIKKEQMEALQENFGKKPFESDKKIYIIEEADKLNSSSANAILKFLEEPEENIVALLIVDNLYQVLPTIVSRCQIIHLYSHSKIEVEDTISELMKLHFVLQEDMPIEKLKEKVEQALHFATYFEKKGQATLLFENNLWLKNFASKEDMLWAFQILIYFYKDALNHKCERFLEIFNTYRVEIEEIAQKNSLESICKKITLLMEAKDSIKWNLNLNLTLDHLILSMKEVSI